MIYGKSFFVLQNILPVFLNYIATLRPSTQRLQEASENPSL